MQMAFHMGVHATDGDRMLKTLLNNRNWLMSDGTEVVTPGRHRGLFEEASEALNGGRASPETEQVLLDALCEHDGTGRLVMSTSTFLGAPGRVCGQGRLYPQIGARAAGLRALFPSAECEFFLALRNPATLISDILPQFAGGGYEALMQGCDPMNLRWRDAVLRLLDATRGARVVLWCHEDVPLIWPEVVRLVGNIPADVPLSGALLYIHELLGEPGLAQLREAMSGQDQMTIARRRALHAELLTRHAGPHLVEQEIQLPGWSQQTVDAVTAQYHADLAEIAVLPGVEFILP